MLNVETDFENIGEEMSEKNTFFYFGDTRILTDTRH